MTISSAPPVFLDILPFQATTFRHQHVSVLTVHSNASTMRLAIIIFVIRKVTFLVHQMNPVSAKHAIPIIHLDKPVPMANGNVVASPKCQGFINASTTNGIL